MQSVRKKYLIIILIFLFAVTSVTAFLVHEEKLDSLQYLSLAEKWSKIYEVDVYHVLSVIETESKGDSVALSKVGAVGLMQIMPDTARWLMEKLEIDSKKVDLYKPDVNIMLGTAYLAYLKQKFKGDMIFCAYNAGEGKVKEWIEKGGEIEYGETKIYLQKIKQNIVRLKEKIYLY